MESHNFNEPSTHEVMDERGQLLYAEDRGRKVGSNSKGWWKIKKSFGVRSLDPTWEEFIDLLVLEPPKLSSTQGPGSYKRTTQKPPSVYLTCG